MVRQGSGSGQADNESHSYIHREPIRTRCGKQRKRHDDPESPDLPPWDLIGRYEMGKCLLLSSKRIFISVAKLQHIQENVGAAIGLMNLE